MRKPWCQTHSSGPPALTLPPFQQTQKQPRPKDCRDCLIPKQSTAFSLPCLSYQEPREVSANTWLALSLPKFSVKGSWLLGQLYLALSDPEDCARSSSFLGGTCNASHLWVSWLYSNKQAMNDKQLETVWEGTQELPVLLLAMFEIISK